MTKFPVWVRKNRCLIVIGILRILLYLLMMISFFGFMAIRNWQLSNMSRTLGTTLLIYIAMSVVMHSVYGGYDVGRKKSKPVISAMFISAVITDFVSYLQLQIMNVNINNNNHLRLFGPDLLYLIACFVVQMLLVIILVRIGNDLYFKMTPPRRCLLVVASPENEKHIRRKIGRYALQWHVEDVCTPDVPDLKERISRTEVVFLDALPAEAETWIIHLCYEAHRDLMCKAQLHDVTLSNARTAIVDDAAFLEMEYSKVSFIQRVIKRLGDIFISIFALLLTSPLFLLISACIRLEDHGPVFFCQERLTIRGKPFLIRKFRTMSPNANEITVDFSATVNDPRITKTGRILRKWRLDEIPQFLNILRGEMSLVGPRPEMLANIQKYKNEVPDFVYREKMKAGLTGMAQIEGRYNTSPEDKLMLDLMYIESFSIWMDIKLILRTFTILTKKDSTEGFDNPEKE